MKWEITGVWKSDGSDATIVVEAPSQKAAEILGVYRGMLIERVALMDRQQAPISQPQPPIEEAFGITRRMAYWFVVIGLLFSPAIFGIPLFVWGIVAISKMNRTN